MRVLSVLFSLLCLSGVSAQYIVDGTSSYNNGWVLTGVTPNNPTLNFTAGNTYNFTITAVGTAHPFAFSSAENTGVTTISAIDPTLYNVSTSGTCGGTATTGFTSTATGCVVNIAIAANATNATLWYKCTIHSPMTAKINIWAAPAAGNATGNATTVAPTTVAPTTVAPTTVAPTTAAPTNGTGNATTAAPTTLAPTTAAPTTGAPTTPAPAPTTGATIASNSFKITGNNQTFAYIFTDANGVQYANPTLKVTAGRDVTFTFDASFTNSRNHPFAFSNNGTTALAFNSFNTTDVFPDNLQSFILTTPTTCVGTYFGIKAASALPNTTCTITVPATTVQAGLSLYYRCARHPLMIGTINVVAAPTNPPSSTGGNSASTIALSGLTIVFAMIVAMMA